jgi:Cd2+/Zn2+-exporting ATPase
MSETCCGGACSPVSPSPRHPAAGLLEKKGWRESGVALVGVSGGLMLAGWAMDAFAAQPSIAIALFTASIALSIPIPARRAVRSLSRRVLDINVLMVIAVAGAMILGEWLEAAAVVWLFGIAQWLEHWSQARARRAIRDLMTLAPPVASLVRGDEEVDVPVDDVRPGDVVIVRPGGRVPVDGRIVAGYSSIDQSPVTGESWPVEKAPDDEVFAGTINGAGTLRIETTRDASGSTIARIVALVEQAQAERAPVQRWVDGFAQRYTPAVVVLAVLLAVIPPLLTGTHDFATWTYRALALLVVACPCALVISTPVSIVAALTAAARSGVLIKGGAHLERLGSIRAVAFDKTGTLTAGAPSVTDVVAVDGASTQGVLAAAAGLEHGSEHPIGRAIVAHAHAERLVVVAGNDFRALPGLGAEATVGASSVVVGSHRLFEERQLCSSSLHEQVEAVEARGRTPVLVGIDGAGVGVLGMADETRGSSQGAVSDLREAGVAHVALLTGDRDSVAKRIADAIGVDEVHGQLLPEDKVAHVRSLRERFGAVAMVGDGINDAPALAAADVGIAMGVAGTDVAIETADVALLTSDLAAVPKAVQLGRSALRTIRTNVMLALGLKLAFVVLAAAGVATLWMAVLADTGASLLVTANSLRLLRIRS